jgi:hypothetical protein
MIVMVMIVMVMIVMVMIIVVMVCYRCPWRCRCWCGLLWRWRTLAASGGQGEVGQQWQKRQPMGAIKQR